MRIGTIARFKPLYNASALMLERVCRNADQMVIGIGSSNKYNLRNPFTADESEAMLKAFLSPRFSNFSIVQIPDFGHIPEYRDGRKWKEFVIEKFGKLDFMISSNDYVRSLLEDTYKLVKPVDIIKVNKDIGVKATQVRVEMARHGDWESLVPAEVSRYIKDNGLDVRFRAEFGEQTLEEELGKNNLRYEKLDEQRKHVEEE